MAETEGEAGEEADNSAKKLSELTELSPEGKLNGRVHHIEGRFERSSFSSPIPPPEVLRGYADIISDSPERLLTMAEEGLKADNKARKSLIEGQNRFHKYNFYRDIFWGCVFLFIFLAVLGAGLVLIVYGHEETALKLWGWGGGGFLAIVCGVFIAYFRHGKPAGKKSEKE